ncbi:hypothetical protein FHS15_001662 [Paenibacillus castaneae]|uniref:DUF309 domain-containing protein n=1 Tax=Paenibacillus castaneae TaxID=474957 RepID=UPI000C9C902E|nr:DUF309 domain-containing protein [Paenibacillus castaneae]NIK76537.1 hypothetical protein [Paenibacillus castaneae]
MTDFPKAYVCYMVEFHASRDYFECHELLEEYWKEHLDDSLADTWVGLIQLAVALYHERRGNLRGANKMYVQAERRLSAAPLERIGIDQQHLLIQIGERIAALHANEKSPYTDINMSIIDSELLALCLQQCEERGLEWLAPSPLHNDSIIHRHTLRDRSDVIAARQRAYRSKKREHSGEI